jgi:glucuronate isomerase
MVFNIGGMRRTNLQTHKYEGHDEGMDWKTPASSGNDLSYLLTLAEYVPLRETIITALLAAGL